MSTAVARRSFTTLAVILLIAVTLSYQVIPSSAVPATRMTGSSSLPPTSSSASRAQARGQSSADGISDKLEEIQEYAMKELKETIGEIGSSDPVEYLWKAVKFISKCIWFIVLDPQARVDTVLNWIVDSMLSPFKPLTDGMESFRRLFRYIHRVRKDTQAGIGNDNPVYQCFMRVHPACVAKATNSVESITIYQYYCAWMFYDQCRLDYWFKKGEWKVPDINGPFPPPPPPPPPGDGW